tara:strand:- start:3940 stop:5679 length:1740 start_codon:yes stop_codon:yes gene_type:complete
MDDSLYYRKTKNEELFKALENSHLGLDSLQNYVPLYEKFFSLNNNNFNSINLNQKYYLHNLKEEINQNTIVATVADNSNNIFKKDVFCKFSPLLDPLKYLTGKYDISSNDMIPLPQYNKQTLFPKLHDKNNTAYIDSFFTYISSQLLHKYDFLNSIDYYGSFLCKQQKFQYNISEDIDYLNESDFFHKNKDEYYSIENENYNTIFNFNSRTNKKKIVINGKLDELIVDIFSKDDFSLFTADETKDSSPSNSVHVVDLSEVCIYDQPYKKSSSSGSGSGSVSSASTYSSKSSNTSIDELSYNGDSGSDSDNESDNSSSSSSSCDEEDIFCSLFNFPVQMITMEKCENTLDYLMENDMLDNKEWTSCLFQIIISLTLFQKSLSFTHNDLHTNNIMYVPTDKKFLYYSVNNITYKVPTYGKIYKLIDFGRSIYKFNGQIMCSDSFHPKGDAASQYNCEPYMDNNKPRLDPNPSFDLCRLACCLYDHFVEDIFDAELVFKENKLAKMIASWLMDDKDRNILYKNSGEERYPEFKLYKMIARTIHNAIPQQQLDNIVFKEYIVSKKKLNKNAKIMNLDKVPNLQ